MPVNEIADQPDKGATPVKITILYDNSAFSANTKSDWGFSCLIEGLDKTILFDTGAKPEILEHNMNALGIDISKIDLIIISHNHWDHTGGLSLILDKNDHAVLYLPWSTPASEVKKIRTHNFEVRKERQPTMIADHVYLTGELGREIPEQSLIIETAEGVVVITGCSHPGIDTILHRVKEISDKDIYLIFGGFHLMRHSDDKIQVIIDEFKRIGVQQCGCTHCTGENAIAQFQNAFGENFIPMGTGRVIELKKF